jgi:hypothetical protein
VFQWQRGHLGRHEGREKRWPDAPVEFLGPGSVFTQVHAIEISLQTDLTLIGPGRRATLSMAKAQQLALTPALLAGKYGKASIRYWYLPPCAPTEVSMTGVPTSLPNMKETGSVALNRLVLDHAD